MSGGYGTVRFVNIGGRYFGYLYSGTKPEQGPRLGLSLRTY